MQRLYFKLSLIILLSLCPLFGYAGEKVKEKVVSYDEVIATVDTINITAAEFINSYEFGPAFVKRQKKSKLKYLQYMINEKLLALDGYSRGIHKTDKVTSIFQEYQNDLAAEQFFRENILAKVNVSEDEIQSVISKKQINVKLKWIYSTSENEIEAIRKEIDSGISFDSLFNLQINDSVFVNDRSLETNFYQLEKKNSKLAHVVDSLEAGNVTIPIHAYDGWYIVKLLNIWQNAITTKTEMQELRYESIRAVKKNEMDSLSDFYVNTIMTENSPVIQEEAFKILRYYLVQYLSRKEIEEWSLNNSHVALSKNIDAEYEKMILVELKNASDVSLTDFLNWFWNRSQYLKLDKSDLRDFSFSLEQHIWRMVRDRLLTKAAYEHGFNKTEEFRMQSSWWRDKIVYSAVRNEIKNSIFLSGKTEIDTLNEHNVDELREILMEKMLHKILSLKQKYPIKIYLDKLQDISVSDENNSNAVEIYYVKRGGLIPRIPYPVIDYSWKNWE